MLKSTKFNFIFVYLNSESISSMTLPASARPYGTLAKARMPQNSPPKYPDFISERVYALHAAARWWFEYRNEVLLLNNV